MSNSVLGSALGTRTSDKEFKGPDPPPQAMLQYGYMLVNINDKPWRSIPGFVVVQRSELPTPPCGVQVGSCYRKQVSWILESEKMVIGQKIPDWEGIKYMAGHLQRLRAVDCTYHQNFLTILGQEEALEISEKKEETQPLFMEWLCVLKSNRTTWLFSIPASPPSLSYTPLANLWQCRQSYYLAKITTTHNGNFCCYKTKANAKWGGERVHVREGLLHLFSGNVLFMLISHSFLP